MRAGQVYHLEDLKSDGFSAAELRRDEGFSLLELKECFTVRGLLHTAH